MHSQPCLVTEAEPDAARRAQKRDTAAPGTLSRAAPTQGRGLSRWGGPQGGYSESTPRAEPSSWCRRTQARRPLNFRTEIEGEAEGGRREQTSRRKVENFSLHLVNFKMSMRNPLREMPAKG